LGNFLWAGPFHEQDVIAATLSQMVGGSLPEQASPVPPGYPVVEGQNVRLAQAYCVSVH